jgi:putative ABC transport system permease protein
VWYISLADLRFRQRRFIIAVAGTSLVFAMALVLAGLSGAWRVEAQRTVREVGADAWVLRKGVAGPFTALATMPEELAEEVAASPGVREADPLIVLRQTVRLQGDLTDANLFGHRLDGAGRPPEPVDGRRARRSGEAVVNRTLGVDLGERFDIGGRTFTTVGIVSGMSYAAGIPNVYVSITDAQAIAFAGERVASVIVTQGMPRELPAGFVAMPSADARADILRPLESGIKSIDTSQMMLWVVAAFIIGAVVYMSALERVRDFAVLKAVGASSASLFAGLALQSVVVSVLSSIAAMAITQLLIPIFPMEVVIPSRAFVVLPVIALGVGLVASLVALRRAVAVEPALAFGGP